MNNFAVLVKDHLYSSIRTKKGIIFLLMYLAVFLLIAYGFFHLQNLFNSELDRQGLSQREVVFLNLFARNALQQVGSNQEYVNFLLNVPFINIALFLVTIIGTPFLILILSYDKIAQEVYDGTLRYILFRSSRLKIYLAKFLSGVIEIAIITGIALLIALIWGIFQIREFELVKSFWFGLRFWLIAQPFLAVFVAFSLIFSSIFKKPFYALLSSFLGFLFLALIPHWIYYISPFDSFYMQGLYYDFSAPLMSSVGFFLIFTVIFLAIGYYIFNQKDL